MTDVAQVAIVNTALNQLKKPPVADLSEQSLRNSNAATQIVRALPTARDTVLRRHGWLCALSYTTLQPTQINGDVNWKYPYVFQLPPAALRVWQVWDPGVYLPISEIDWISFGLITPPMVEFVQWEANTVDTDQGALQVVRANHSCLLLSFVRRCNYGAMTPDLADAVAFDAASRVCLSVTSDQALAAKLETKAENKIMLAIGADSTQEGGQMAVAYSIPERLRMISRF